MSVWFPVFVQKSIQRLSRLLIVTHVLSLWHKLVFSPVRTDCQGDNGEQENPGAEDLSPFAHTSPEEPAGPHVIAADNDTGGGRFQCVWTAGRICYSLIPEEWQVPIVFILSLLSCHDSFPYLLGTGYGGIFFVFCLVFSAFYSSYGLHCIPSIRGIWPVMENNNALILKCSTFEGY